MVKSFLNSYNKRIGVLILGSAKINIYQKSVDKNKNTHFKRLCCFFFQLHPTNAVEWIVLALNVLENASTSVESLRAGCMVIEGHWSLTPNPLVGLVLTVYIVSAGNKAKMPLLSQTVNTVAYQGVLIPFPQHQPRRHGKERAHWHWSVQLRKQIRNLLQKLKRPPVFGVISLCWHKNQGQNSMIQTIQKLIFGCWLEFLEVL